LYVLPNRNKTVNFSLGGLHFDHPEAYSLFRENESYEYYDLDFQSFDLVLTQLILTRLNETSLHNILKKFNEERTS
jgi:hypothetical protein